MSNLLYENLSYKVIGAAREVYKELGHGYLESVYEDALCYELDLLSIEYFHPIDYGLVGRSRLDRNTARAILCCRNHC